MMTQTMRCMCYGKGVKTMTEKKFHLPSIIIAAVSVVLAVFTFPIESILVSIAAIVVSALKRKTHRTMIGVVLAVSAILFAAGTLAFFMFVIKQRGSELAETGYWLIDLFLK